MKFRFRDVLAALRACFRDDRLFELRAAFAESLRVSPSTVELYFAELVAELESGDVRAAMRLVLRRSVEAGHPADPAELMLIADKCQALADECRALALTPERAMWGAPSKVPAVPRGDTEPSPPTQESARGTEADPESPKMVACTICGVYFRPSAPPRDGDDAIKSAIGPVCHSCDPVG